MPLLTCMSARIPFTRLSISGWNVEMHKTIVTIVTSYRWCCCRIYISIADAANAPKIVNEEQKHFVWFVCVGTRLGRDSTHSPSVMSERAHDSERIGRISSACSLIWPFEISVRREFHRRKTFRSWDSVNFDLESVADRSTENSKRWNSIWINWIFFDAFGNGLCCLLCAEY